LQFSVLKRDARANAYALTSSGAVAALSRLRQQSFPSLAEIPFFSPTPRAATAPPSWLGNIARQAFYAAVLAGLVLTAAITIPAVISSRAGDSVSTATALHSSIGATGTADTTVEDLSVSTFVGRVPFVQQLNLYGAASPAPSVQRFVMGARQAEIASYVSNVGEQVTLRYLSNAVATTKAIGTWKKAAEEGKVAEQQRQAAAYLTSGASRSWQAAPISVGTKLYSTTTFYDCNVHSFCGGMANGQQAFPGAAACSYNMPFGTKFRIENDPAGRVFVCADRGALSASWVDIWFYDNADGWAWQSTVGTRSNIIIVG
jgi:hypothetical protein